MCDDHGHASRGPGALGWGRWALSIGTLALTAVAVAALDPLASGAATWPAALAAGPLLALAGWSFGRFLESGSDSVAARLTGPAHLVAGAALAAGGSLASAGVAVAIGVAALVLAATLLAHPLFGRAWAAGALAVGVLLVASAGGAFLPWWVGVLAWLAGSAALGVRTAGAVKRLSRGYAPWPEPALV